MALRDYFRPPVENKHSWDELHGMWPAVIVQQLFSLLPEGYVAALLQRDVCVSLVDLVTIRQFNLYADLLELVGKGDPLLGAEPAAIYAATVRGRKRDRRRPLTMDVWFIP